MPGLTQSIQSLTTFKGPNPFKPVKAHFLFSPSELFQEAGCFT